MDPMTARIIVTSRQRQLQAEAAQDRLAADARKGRQRVVPAFGLHWPSTGGLRQAFLLLAQHHA